MKPVFQLLALMLLTLGLCTLPTSTVEAQLLKKIKQKAEEVLGKKEEEKTTETTTTSSSTANSGTKGKKLTPPDVKLHIGDAKTATNEQRFADAKFNIQQALAGVELEIGYAILESLPQTVNGMNYQPDEDQVTSTGVGFVGLVIGRAYEGSKKSMEAGIVNNSMLVSAYSMALSNSNYNSSDQEQKPISLDGNRGVIKYNDGDYELGIPLGQNSVFTLQCRGFADENEVINVAKQFKVNDIKKQLGEQ